jgi:hypothetical protein
MEARCVFLEVRTEFFFNFVWINFGFSFEKYSMIHILRLGQLPRFLVVVPSLTMNHFYVPKQGISVPAE